jgi:hypothetical protein
LKRMNKSVDGWMLASFSHSVPPFNLIHWLAPCSQR